MAKKEKDLQAIIFAEAAKEVATEGITSKEEATARVNVIIKDASLEQPKTDLGRIVRERAQMIASSVESPYMAPEKFDYNKLRRETVDPAITEILKLIGSFTDIVPPTASEQGEQEQLNKEAFKAHDRFSFEILQILNKNNVALTDYQYLFQELKGIFAITEKIINEQVGGHRAEIMSRLLGKRDPAFNKFDQGFATYKDLTDTVLKTRAATGDRIDDYFHITPEDEENASSEAK